MPRQVTLGHFGTRMGRAVCLLVCSLFGEGAHVLVFGLMSSYIGAPMTSETVAACKNKLSTFDVCCGVACALLSSNDVESSGPGQTRWQQRHQHQVQGIRADLRGHKPDRQGQSDGSLDTTAYVPTHWRSQAGPAGHSVAPKALWHACRPPRGHKPDRQGHSMALKTLRPA